MSSPTRSPLALPGEFPDDETLLADILAELEVRGAPIGSDRVDTDTSGIDPPAITVYAPPGRSSVNRLGDLKTCFLYVDCVGADRDEAKTMGDTAQKLLGGYRHGGLWKNVQIRRIEQVTSPTELPLRYTEDPRHRESGWAVLLRPHRGDPVYP